MPDDNDSGVNRAAAAGLTRHAVALGSLYLVSKGYVSNELLEVIFAALIAAMVIALLETALRLPEGTTFKTLKAVHNGDEPPPASSNMSGGPTGGDIFSH